MKSALIVGVSGQDGAYLARLLLARGYRVTGTSRHSVESNFVRLAELGIADQVTKVSLDPACPGATARLIAEADPDEIYNLGGQSSVAASFLEPVDTMHGIVSVTEVLLEAIRQSGRARRFYSAGSSETFGDTGDGAADESHAFDPKSPYGVAKAAAFWQVANYRQTYGMFAVTGIKFNHESRLRPATFAIPKIVQTAHAIKNGTAVELVLGDMNVYRDWGWAPEYVDAIWRMLQQDEPRDYVVATGHSMSLRDAVGHAFDYFGLDWRDHVRQDTAMFRPNELCNSRGNPARAAAELGWRADTFGRDLIRTLAASVAKPA